MSERKNIYDNYFQMASHVGVFNNSINEDPLFNKLRFYFGNWSKDSFVRQASSNYKFPDNLSSLIRSSRIDNKIIDIYVASNIYEKYPIYDYQTESNCKRNKETIIELDRELRNTETDKPNMDLREYNSRIKVVNDLKKRINLFLSNQKCDDVNTSINQSNTKSNTQNNMTATSIDTTRQEILDIVNGFRGQMCQYYDMNMYFSNSLNNESIKNTISKYGMPRRFSGSGSGDNMYKFYLACLLYSKFPKLDYTQTKNCSKLKELKVNLDNEILNIDKQKLAGGGDCVDVNIWYKYASLVANDYQSEVLGALSTLGCQKVIDEEEEEDLKQDLSDTASTPNPNAATNKVGIYIGVVVFLIVVVVVGRKLIKKD